MEFRKVNITLPVQLFNKAQSLVDSGLYSNFSDLIRDSLRKELKEDLNLLEEMDEWKVSVEQIRSGLRKSELGRISKADILKRLKKSREKADSESYA